MARKTSNDDGGDLIAIRKKDKPPYTDVLLVTGPAISGLLAGLAIPDLIGAEGFLGHLKSSMIALSAAGIAYGINRLAIERGALQTAIGTPLAGAVSIGSIAVVGIGLFAATFGGLVKDETDILQYEQYGEELRVYADDSVRAAQTSAQVAPIIGAIQSDLSAKYACEIKAGCISNAGISGEGPTSRTIGSKQQQVASVAQAVLELKQTRNAAEGRLAGLQSEFNGIIGKEDLGPAERRRQLQEISNEIGQTISRLQQAVPTALISAYAEDLREGALVPRNEEASQKLTDIMRGHARTLSAVINTAETQAGTPPSFPAKAGVSDTFGYIFHFLPLALIILVVELVFPSVLFFYTLFAYRQRVKRDYD
ncbi:hypothetical protein [uncultured Roseobacter sp.]|uniref:hypothetical protein n=1 Tax=uncultured Roseobacter sp. TaxID=114847 RepID=UPI002639A98A|nr:hypothetical protein [uncultured Roseobacter sp.]